jgi:pyridoxal phosphate enzyme (YggS family)
MNPTARIQSAKERIAAAAARSGRSADAVELLVVSKGVVAERLVELLDGGVTSFGENRVQELEEKRAALQGLRPTASIRWELIGPLQSNKVRRAVALADRISSVDRIELLEALVRAAREATKELHVALQVNVDNDPAKAGFSAAALRAALPAIGVAIGGGGVIIDGLFTVGRMVATAEEARATFTALRSVAVDVRPAAVTAGFTIGPLLSMGMSGDYEVAVEEGATQVRLGSAIFGARA